MMRVSALVVLTLALLPWSANAGRYDEVRKTVESSMNLSADITVGPAGEVHEFVLDQQDKLGPEVIDFVQRQVASWKFEPQQLDGKPVSVKNKVYLRLMAKSLENDQYEVQITGTYFQPLLDDDPEKNNRKVLAREREQGRRETKMPPPRYPENAVRSGMSGTVYLLVKVGSDGKVQDLLDEQVNLRFVGPDRVMMQARKLFAQSAMATARRWVLPPPPEGLSDHVVRVPVDYCLGSDCAQYGKWQGYVPGPRQRAPWDKEEEAIGFSPDALPANGGIFPVGEKGGLKLLTPLQQEG